MTSKLIINHKIPPFNKSISINGDKSLSIRWVIFASIASGISKSTNLLLSEDVMAAIKIVKKLGAKIKFSKNICEIKGVGIDGYKYKKNLILNAKNSGTAGRLILGLLINSKNKIKLIGDQSYKEITNKDFYSKFVEEKIQEKKKYS